jgi:hypothetical protein
VVAGPVVRFASTAAVSSIASPAGVSALSVRNGRISLTVLTSVVLPAPNPPAMRILTGTGEVCLAWSE